MTGDIFLELRKKNGLTQEQAAEIFGVSRQAVQKWETGLSLPETEKLIAIAKYFGVSTDRLLCCEDRRGTEEVRLNRNILPQYKTPDSAEFYSAHLATEYAQSVEEGKDIEKYKSLFEAIGLLDAGIEKEQLADTAFSLICRAPQVEGYRYDEPSELEEILKLRKSLTGALPEYSPDRLREQIKGAWVGRICGCLLGKTVEGIHLNEFIPFLKETGNYPMHRYILRSDVTDKRQSRYSFDFSSRCFADTIACAPADDDTNYTVLGQLLIEKYSRDFTPSDVAELWIDSQPKNAYCTAERVAFRNLVNGYQPPDTAIYKNPFREWIGAQIRADYFGYINPGDPQTAAEMAYRDASISHIKNGIYGEMFVSAMLAGAACLDSMEEVILCGLSQIPATSRLYEQVLRLLEDYKSGISSEECFRKIYARYDDNQSHDWCHTISNALIVAAALLCGQGDYAKSICLAVQAGFDTDCNGATVGSVIGMMKGIGAIGESWTAPIHNTLETSIISVGKVSIDELTEKTIEHIGKR